METYEAAFEIESKSDAYAVERLMDRIYDAIREESRSVHDDRTDATATLDQFAALRDATRQPSPGRLRVVYEPRSGGFSG